MKESIEKIQSGRELLKNLEAEHAFVFHGSENPNISKLEPRQAYTMVEGQRVEDEKPAVHASPLSDIAILMALINRKNCPNGFDSGFQSNQEGKLIMHATQEALDQLTSDSRGYVYVFSKDVFTPRGRTQAVSYQEVKPLQIVEVTKGDLSEEIEVR